jgi:hypothetical protein
MSQRASGYARPEEAALVSEAAVVRHKAAIARREANAIRRQRAEENRKRRAFKQHGFHLSAYEREDSDFYPSRRFSRPAWRSGFLNFVSGCRGALSIRVAATALSVVVWLHSE